MKKKNQAIGILRDRGQLTIPDDMRNSSTWMYPGAAVQMSWSNSQLIIQAPKPITDWKKIAKLRAKLKHVHGASSISAAAFLRKDRQSH